MKEQHEETKVKLVKMEDKAASSDDKYKQLNLELDQIKIENDER